MARRRFFRRWRKLSAGAGAPGDRGEAGPLTAATGAPGASQGRSPAEMEHPEFARFDLTSLRTGVMAGLACPIELMRHVVERMHMPEITIVYEFENEWHKILERIPEAAK